MLNNERMYRLRCEFWDNCSVLMYFVRWLCLLEYYIKAGSSITLIILVFSNFVGDDFLCNWMQLNTSIYLKLPYSASTTQLLVNIIYLEDDWLSSFDSLSYNNIVFRNSIPISSSSYGFEPCPNDFVTKTTT